MSLSPYSNGSSGRPGQPYPLRRASTTRIIRNSTGVSHLGPPFVEFPQAPVAPTTFMLDPDTHSISESTSSDFQPASKDTRRASMAPLERMVDPAAEPPGWKGAVIIGSVSLMTLMSTVLGGILAVALPKVAADINLEEGLLLWPASVYSLACACTLLFFGSLSDVVGSKNNYLVGSFLSMGWVLACGLSRTGIQLIVFRAMNGVSLSMCLPSSISILTATFKPGQRRNTAFACLGGAQPSGFLIGLVIGGILTDLVSWRLCFYLIAGLNGVVLMVSFWCIPQDPRGEGTAFERFRNEVDYVGVFLLSAALGLLSYALAAVTVDTSSIRLPSNIVMLALAALLFPIFGMWVQRQENRNRPALIPNTLWRNSVFVSMSALSFLSWATVTANQYFMALFFEKVQGLTAFQTSLRFLPIVASGLTANIIAGSLVHRVRADFLIAGGVLLSSVTPLLMALVDPALPYWAMAFPATLLSPIAADVVLVVANLAITNIFPSEYHGLAGGLTNTLAQLGISLGLNFTAILANTVTFGSSYDDKSSPEALEIGYRASFWASFGITLSLLLIAFLGLRKIDKVGAVKMD
ncbi:major facilitator superfamily domain-containing protein [Xylariales sp. AK1849]|nr:major facilitator superfamily domain-containing protein [Xylariales sp. AK1849]